MKLAAVKLKTFLYTYFCLSTRVNLMLFHFNIVLYSCKLDKQKLIFCQVTLQLVA